MRLSPPGGRIEKDLRQMWTCSSPPFFSRLVLVEPAEIAVVALVEGLVGDRLQVRLVERGENELERILRPFEVAGKCDVEGVACTFEALARTSRLGLPLCRQRDITPAGKQVFFIPLTLPVAHEHENAFHSLSPSLR